MVVGRLLSYWEGNFSEAMLNFRGVVSSWVWEISQEKPTFTEAEPEFHSEFFFGTLDLSLFVG